jgi:CRISPR associated protein
MIYLTEISVPRKAAIDAAMTYDPLVASDMNYCLKTWMADKPSVACRPWRASSVGAGVRITGWRREAPGSGVQGAYVGMKEVSLSVGQSLAIAGRFIALRRVKSAARDAAAGRADPKAAYKAWLRERLVDVMPSATVEEITIERFHQRRVLRKVAHERERTRVREELIPVVEAVVLLTVHIPAAVEDWLASGVGPQKAFGYGAFIPTADPREAD